MAFGEMSMTAADFWDSSPREFYNRQIGFYEVENRKEQRQWERTRWQTLFLLNIQLPKGKQLKPHDLAHFAWEPLPKELEPMPPEVMEKVIAAMDRDAKSTNK